MNTIDNKIHITLVGGQPIPVYVGVTFDQKATQIVLVCSRDTSEEAERLKEQLADRQVRTEVTSPTDISEMTVLAQRLRSEFDGCQVTLNLTSGTKLWALAFYQCFASDANCRIIYVDQTNQIVDIKTQEKFKGEIDAKTRLKLYGAKFSSFRQLSYYTDSDYSAINRIKQIREPNYNKFPFASLTTLQQGDRRDGLRTDDHGSSLVFSQQEQKATIRLGHRSYTLQSDHLSDILFNTAWFELMVAKDIKKNSNVRNIWLNCEFLSAAGNPLNEIDIIVELPGRLLFVECKTMIHSITDLDKFRSAVRNFSGTSSKALFVTLDRPGRKTQGLYKMAMEKCKDNGIATYNYALWRDNPTTLPTLSQIIDSLLTGQNAK